jgi:Ca-activated chloride channel homolog
MFVLLFIIACEQFIGDEKTARDVYNEGTVALTSQKYSEASELLLSARDEAKSDGELRQFSAYNLALSHALNGMNFEEQEPQKASEEYAQAASWFRDAVRLDPDDEDSRKNLEVVLKRMQLLADRLNSGQNGLEEQMDRLLDDSRTLRDQLRELSNKISSTGDDQDPTGYRTQFDSLAVQVRTLQADASTVLQLSASERRNIEDKVEQERTEEDQIRSVQLTYLELHLTEGRDEISDTRRKLRRLDIERAVQNMEETVQSLKRAREQLLSPITVLQSLVQEEQALIQMSEIKLASELQSLNLEDNRTEVALPSWFTIEYLSGEQQHIQQRSNEILQRFEQSSNTNIDESIPEEQKNMLILIKDAVPPLSNAVQEMTTANNLLQQSNVKQAMESEQQALVSLILAVERFADVKNLIEITYASQKEIIELITPDNAKEENTFSAEEREQLIQTKLTENIGRLERMIIALSLEKNKQLQQAQAQAAEQDNPQEDQTESIDALFEEAENLRAETYASLITMQQEMNDSQNVSASAQAAEESLTKLRILFFSIVEHLKDVLERQGSLRDTTSEAASDEYEQMRENIPLLQPEQSQLEQKTQALAETLQKQADAATEQGQPERSESIGDAYVETAMAVQHMQDVLEQMQMVYSEEGGMSHDLEEATASQLKAMDAIVAAIKALQPPQQNEGDEQQENQEQQMSRQQAERRLQAAKEREAERAAKQQQAAPEPVEKDW